MRVRIDGGDEAPGTLDPGGAERDLLGRVPFDFQEALAARATERVGQDVDDHDLQARMDELAGDRGTDASEPAEDVVVPQLAHRIGHSLRLPTSARRFNNKVLGHDADRSEDETNPGHRQDHRPDPARVIEGAHFPEPHGREGDDRHVDGVQERPAGFDYQVARGPDDDRAGDDAEPDSGCGRRLSR